MVLDRSFLRFVAVSGIGWLLDACVFVSLLSAGFAPYMANIISCYAGLTFVYFASARFAFHKCDAHHTRFLAIFWTYQVFSILVYSWAIGWLARGLADQWQGLSSIRFSGVGAKVVITPVNLCTNFIFMKLLTHFMTPVVRESSVNMDVSERSTL